MTDIEPFTEEDRLILEDMVKGITHNFTEDRKSITRALDHIHELEKAANRLVELTRPFQEGSASREWRASFDHLKQLL